MGKKLKAFSKVSVALALLGAAVPAVEATPTAMAAKKSTKKSVKKSTKKAKKAKKSTKKKATKKVANKFSKKKATKKSVKKVAKKKVVKKTAKKAAPKKITTKKPVKKATPASAYVTVYSGKGNPLNLYVWSMGGKNEGKLRIKKGTKVVTGEQKVMNGQLMYRVYQEYWEPKPGDKHFWDTKKENYSGEMWVPAKDVQQDFFKDVQFIDYADTTPVDVPLRETATPAQIKVAYDADLAAAEKDQASYREATAWAGILWDSAHPLEGSIYDQTTMKIKISKNTYEKHNESYAQDIRGIALRPGGCYTKEAYTAYMKGEKAYREYEAKWAAKYPNITKAMNELYKKENVDVSKWRFNENIYTVDNIRK
ncbi:hypothetical protein OCH80_09645 [Lactobacillus sp. 23-2]|uniref:hypothetical protein n=1 Tax=Lactobacillus sp. 23-2 TaxID=2981842 RepID=UPI003835EB76